MRIIPLGMSGRYELSYRKERSDGIASLSSVPSEANGVYLEKEISKARISKEIRSTTQLIASLGMTRESPSKFF